MSSPWSIASIASATLFKSPRRTTHLLVSTHHLVSRVLVLQEISDFSSFYFCAFFKFVLFILPWLSCCFLCHFNCVVVFKLLYCFIFGSNCSWASKLFFRFHWFFFVLTVLFLVLFESYWCFNRCKVFVVEFFDFWIHTSFVKVMFFLQCHKFQVVVFYCWFGCLILILILILSGVYISVFEALVPFIFSYLSSYLCVSSIKFLFQSFPLCF